MLTVLVVGASGFVGSAVVRAAAGRPDLRVRTMSRTVLPGDHVCGDIIEASDTRAALVGVDLVVHCAHASPGDPAAMTTSELGTQTLCRAAGRQGARVVLASTTAVYGNGPHRNLREERAPVRPVSPLSRARAAAEEVVRSYRGLVVRAPLTFGHGDRWLIPTAISVQRALGWIDAGRSRHTVIHVDDLAGGLLALARSGGAGATYHLGNPNPVSVRTLLEAVASSLDIGLNPRDISRAQAEQVLGPRLVSLLADEHTYDSSAAWAKIPTGPRHDPTRPTQDEVAWYQRVLAEPAALARPGAAE
ncbi:NAD-dependent epimerase/dehydratase family protein [Angustibacter sp. McL0619]|uniref:NAD-dependent epimerase/dehydratase family protein n=1 Tax=Angustibacter sp. McL0619 TaxID=3415676 RepID=UPI003CF4B12A